MRVNVKEVALHFLISRPMRGLFSRWRVRYTPILMLHRFSPDDHERGKTSRQQLETCCQWISQSGLTGITLGDWCRSVSAGEWPERVVCLTIDDGYMDFKEVAFPILQEYGLPATVFVASRYIDGGFWYWWDRIEFAFKETTRSELEFETRSGVSRFHWPSSTHRDEIQECVVQELKRIPDSTKWERIRKLEASLEVAVPSEPVGEYRGLTWADVRYLLANGIEFGGHTVSHPVLSRLADREATWEVQHGIDAIELNTGTRPSTFAYPNGRLEDFTPAVVEALRNSGIRGAVIGEGGVANASIQDAEEEGLFRIPRVPMPKNEARVLQVISGVEAFKQDFRRLFGGAG